MFGVSVSDMQKDDVNVSGNKISGTLKYLSGPNAITDKWGEGYFLAFTMNLDGNDWSKYDSVKVGVQPSQGSGLVEIIEDPDKNGIVKIGNDVAQKFVIVASKDGKSIKQAFDLSGLDFEEPEAEG